MSARFREKLKKATAKLREETGDKTIEVTDISDDEELKRFAKERNKELRVKSASEFYNG